MSLIEELARAYYELERAASEEKTGEDPGPYQVTPCCPYLARAKDTVTFFQGHPALAIRLGKLARGKGL